MSTNNERMLYEWRKLWNVRGRGEGNSLEPLCMDWFQRGYEARTMEMADWSARVAGLEAELLHWKALAKER